MISTDDPSARIACCDQRTDLYALVAGNLATIGADAGVMKLAETYVAFQQVRDAL